MLPASLHRRTSGSAFAWALLVALVLLLVAGLALFQAFNLATVSIAIACLLLAIVVGSWILMTGR